MKIIDLKKMSQVKAVEKPMCLVLGNFDGVHEGHSKLIETAIAEGKKNGTVTAAWTFEEHPQVLLNSENAPMYLTTIEEKNDIFAEKGLDYVIYEDFSKVKDMSPLEFIHSVLIDTFDCRTAVCGFNFKFGKMGSGNAELLKSVMADLGRSAVIVSPVLRMNKIVSSTAVRFFVENGLMEEAAEMLGRPYSVKFPVLHGNKLGRTIGIPTINQSFPPFHIIPQKGIYACTCYIGDDIFLGVANVGTRPTVSGGGTVINCETHIINYNGWLYGKKIRVCFYKKLRDEKKFESIEALKTAVEYDISRALDYFSQK